ncbi:MAG: universal stress protein [Armatimonadota bacterium]
MYKNILVPLDGSGLAEQALTHATELAKSLGAKVTLLYVLEPVGLHPEPGLMGPVLSYSFDMEDEEKSAEEYLEHIEKRLQMDGVDASRYVLQGDPASVIVDFAAEKGIDLIAMSTHGRSGIRRWVYGSVADRVLRSARVPVLLIRSTEKELTD